VAIPEDFSPGIGSRRRWLFLTERRRAREGDDTGELVFRALRLAAYGQPFPSDLPARSVLIAADVIALEEVRGADPNELRAYGLTSAQAVALITRLETDPELAAMPSFTTGPRTSDAYEQDDVTLRASAAATVTGNGDVYELGDRGTLRLALDVTAVSGTLPTLHVQVQTKNNASDSWRTLEAFPVASAIGVAYLSVPGCDRYVRTQHTIGGTGSPSFTFSVTGNAV